MRQVARYSLVVLASCSWLAAIMAQTSNPDTCSDWSAVSSNPIKKRAERCGGTFASTVQTDQDRECLKEVLINGKARLDHRWTFNNIPAGTQHLTFEGQRLANSNDDFQFFYEAPAAGIVAIPGAVINDTLDRPNTLPMGLTTTQTGTVYVLLNDTYRPISPSDTQRDTVYVNFLRIVTRPVITGGEAVCDDNQDNDCDGAADCGDSNCRPPERAVTEDLCSDLKDNDCDGLSDAADPDCVTGEICNDGIDNDGDGCADCGDADCCGVSPCEPPCMGC